MLQGVLGHISSRLYPYFWKYRHWWSEGWPESYLSRESIDQPHRQLLCDELEKFQSFQSVLEYGCGPGANLICFANRFPHAKLYGVDVSEYALELGRKRLWFKNVTLFNVGAQLPNFDILVTDAFCIYKKDIHLFFKFVRHYMTKGYIGCEWHTDSDQSFMAGRHWVHNFKKLLPGCEVTKFKWDVPDEGWDTYGHIIRWEK